MFVSHYFPFEHLAVFQKYALVSVTVLFGGREKLIISPDAAVAIA
jgi:hypothetical protein